MVGVLTLNRPLERLPPRADETEAEAEAAVVAVLLAARGVSGFCFSRVGVERDDLVLASVLTTPCSTSLPLSSIVDEATGSLLGFRPRLGLLGAASSLETVDAVSCLASSFSTSTSSVSLSSALIIVLFRLPRRGCSSMDEEVFEGDVANVDAAEFDAGVVLVLVNLELFRELGSESSSSLSVSFLVEVRLLCLLSAGDPVREPFDVTEEGVPALELSLGPLDGTTVGLLFVMASEGVGAGFSVGFGFLVGSRHSHFLQ